MWNVSSASAVGRAGKAQAMLAVVPRGHRVSCPVTTPALPQPLRSAEAGVPQGSPAPEMCQSPPSLQHWETLPVANGQVQQCVSPHVTTACWAQAELAVAFSSPSHKHPK